MKNNLTLAAICLTVSFAGVLNANDPVNENTTPVKSTPTAIAPHCQVPCGIYADQLRFEQMLEDTATIAKAITSINELAAGMADAPPSGKAINQATRWVSTLHTPSSFTRSK
jgi:nickel superoxide dismutase